MTTAFHVPRRSLVKGAAWTVPAIALAAGAPSVAASTQCPTCLTSAPTTVGTLAVTNSVWSAASLSMNLPLTASPSCLTSFPGLKVSLNTAVITLGVPSGTGVANWTVSASTGIAPGTYTTLSGTSTIPMTLTNLVPGTEPPAPSTSDTYTDLPGTGILSICLSGTAQYTPIGLPTVTQNITICLTLCTQGTRTYKKLGTGNAKVTFSYAGATTCTSSITCS